MSYSFMLHLVWGQGKGKICHKDDIGFHRELRYRAILITWGFFPSYIALEHPAPVTLTVPEGCLVILNVYLPHSPPMPGPGNPLVHKRAFTSWMGLQNLHSVPHHSMGKLFL